MLNITWIKPWGKKVFDSLLACVMWSGTSSTCKNNPSFHQLQWMEDHTSPQWSERDNYLQLSSVRKNKPALNKRCVGVLCCFRWSSVLSKDNGPGEWRGCPSARVLNPSPLYLSTPHAWVITGSGGFYWAHIQTVLCLMKKRHWRTLSVWSKWPALCRSITWPFRSLSKASCAAPMILGASWLQDFGIGFCLLPLFAFFIHIKDLMVRERIEAILLNIIAVNKC